MSGQDRLGSLVDITKYNPGDKDAVHVPIIAGYAGNRLKPMDRVRKEGDTFYKDKEGLYITDPLYPFTIEIGSLFWACPIPGTIKNLSHHWENSDSDTESVQKLKDRIQELEEENSRLSDESENDPCRGCYS